MSIAWLLFASIAYAAGGVFMKLSDGATRVGATIAFLALFAAGAVMQAIGMRSGDMGVSYVFVLGAEAVAAVILSIALFRESYSVSRIAAIIFVVVGIAWLRHA